MKADSEPFAFSILDKYKDELFFVFSGKIISGCVKLGNTLTINLLEIQFEVEEIINCEGKKVNLANPYEFITVITT